MEKSVKRKRNKRRKAPRHAGNIVNTDESLAAQKKFQVTDPVTDRTYMIVFCSYEDFVRRCKVRFAIQESNDVQFFDADMENVEIDKTELKGLYNGFNIIIKILDNSSISNEIGKEECFGSDIAPEDNIWFDHRRIFRSTPLIGRNKSREETMSRDRFGSTIEMPKYYNLAMTSIKTEENSVTGKLDGLTISTPDSEAEISEAGCISSSEEVKNAQGTGNATKMAIYNAELTKRSEVEKGSAIRKHVAEFGLKGIETVLETYLEEWKSKPLKICITGMTGKGKSSLINSLRNISPSEPGAAEVGEVECTKECRSYPHPTLNNVVLCDVPGVGTEWFPKETYLKDIDVDQFDFFLIVSSERFTENDIWLTKEIDERNKKFYFIRTKVELDMDSIFERKLDSFNEEKEFENLKMKITSQDLRDFGEGYFKCFLISNKARYRNHYDLPKLQKQLENDVDFKRQDAMLVGIVALSKNVFEEKAALLLARANTTALISGSVAAIPIPFISTGIDIAIILQEILFYRTQFGLEDESLQNLLASVHSSEYILKSCVKFHTPKTLFTDVGLKGYLSKYFANKVGEKIVQYVVPVVGTVFSCVMSYNFTTALLQDVINMMKADATNVLMFVANKDNEDIDNKFVQYKCKLDIFQI